MSDCTVDEARTWRKALEKNIAEYIRTAIDAFESATGIAVSDVRVDLVETTRLEDMRKRRGVRGVTVEVDL